MPLTRKEKATWIRTVVAEARRDETAIAAQGHLVALMDVCAAEGGWCGCEDHTGAIAEVQHMLWREPPPMG